MPTLQYGVYGAYDEMNCIPLKSAVVSIMRFTCLRLRTNIVKELNLTGGDGTYMDAKTLQRSAPVE